MRVCGELDKEICLLRYQQVYRNMYIVMGLPRVNRHQSRMRDDDIQHNGITIFTGTRIMIEFDSFLIELSHLTRLHMIVLPVHKGINAKEI